MKYAGWIIGLLILVGVGVAVYRFVPGTNQLPLEDGAVDMEKVQVVFTKMTPTDMEFVNVDRAIVKTNVFEEMVKLTLEELIKGPTSIEKAQGLSVAFNAGTKVNYVRVVSSLLTVDFNEKFDTPMGGSARVRSIAQTLDRTIRQFPIEGVSEIKFTVNNGARAAILEP